METVFVLLAVFLLMPLIATHYANGVHRLGAWIIRLLPARVGVALSKRLYVNEYDIARNGDEITSARHSQERKAGIPHRGDLVD